MPETDSAMNDGLSPCVRGNPGLEEPVSFSVRSIPVRTGEPVCLSACFIVYPVYPRAYGGTVFDVESLPDGEGLSPCVRGNHSFILSYRSWIRSIPVRTGEPACRQLLYSLVAVYPRAYGGTYPAGLKQGESPGLSPCVRGNHICLVRGFTIGRSIPVRTGEPGVPFTAAGKVWVYPRAYGGTSGRSYTLSFL